MQERKYLLRINTALLLLFVMLVCCIIPSAPASAANYNSTPVTFPLDAHVQQSLENSTSATAILNTIFWSNTKVDSPKVWRPTIGSHLRPSTGGNLCPTTGGNLWQPGRPTTGGNLFPTTGGNLWRPGRPTAGGSLFPTTGGNLWRPGRPTTGGSLFPTTGGNLWRPDDQSNHPIYNSPFWDFIRSLVKIISTPKGNPTMSYSKTLFSSRQEVLPPTSTLLRAAGFAGKMELPKAQEDEL